MKNQAGFVLVINLILCALLISLLSLSAGLYICIQNQEKNQHLCQKRLLETQLLLSRGLKKLMELNPKAAILLTKEAHAIQNLQAAIVSQNPALIAAATARLQKIKWEQEKLRDLQILTINESKGLANFRLQKFKLDFVKENKKVSIKNLQLSKVDLAVKTTPVGATAPLYTPQISFTEKQKLEASWQTSTLDLLPSFIRKYFSQTNLFRSSCAASIEGSNLIWHPRLIKAKS